MADPSAALRSQFPVFARQKAPFHYLDSAASSQICQAALDAMIDFEGGGRANVKRGIYPLASAATEAFDRARREIAAYLGAPSPSEIVITSGTTSALNILAHGLGAGLSPGDEIILTGLEHHANILPWQFVRDARGAVLRILPVDADGRIDLDLLGDLVSDRCRVIAVTHASNVTGAITAIEPLSRAARRAGARLVIDGAQQAAHGPLDVKALGIDAYAISGHKMFGPTGVGALWARSDLLETMPPLLGGGEMIRSVSFERSVFAPPPDRFEAGTPPIAGAIGMAAAATWLRGLDWAALADHERRLTARLLHGLQQIEGCRIVGPPDVERRLGVVAFDMAGVHAHDLCHLLGERGICLRGGHHCAQPLMERFDLVATARASLAPYSNASDVDALLGALPEIVAKFR